MKTSRLNLRLLPTLFLLTFAIQTFAVDYTIAVIPKGSTHEFWKSIHAGAIKAQRELEAGGDKVQIIWKGPLKEDDRDQQIQTVENFVTKRVSGIVLAPLDARALVKPIQTAVKADIPVVLIDSGAESDLPVSLVATDNFKGGQMAGDELARLLGSKGKVILLRCQVGSASTDQRERGFLDAMKKYPDLKLISVDQYGGATREAAFQASQNLLNRYGREVDGIFTPNESTSSGMLLALKNIGRAGGSVKFVGFDTGTQLVDALAVGDMQALVVQDPVKMGYLGVKTMVSHLHGESVEKRIDTGVTLVTKEKMDSPEIQALLHPPIEKYQD